jgi:hypothetical protein
LSDLKKEEKKRNIPCKISFPVHLAPRDMFYKEETTPKKVFYKTNISHSLHTAPSEPIQAAKPAKPAPIVAAPPMKRPFALPALNMDLVGDTPERKLAEEKLFSDSRSKHYNEFERLKAWRAEHPDEDEDEEEEED